MFRKRYADVFLGPPEWQKLPVPEGQTYKWESDSTYVKLPPISKDCSRARTR